jgi:glycosyltransferase involved in cell wall biosynthesis
MEALEGIYAGIIRSPGTPRISPKGRISGKRLKVLVSAYACGPDRGSEPGTGWGFVKAISEHHDVWIITEEREFKQVIESYLDRHPELRRRLKFQYIPEKINQRMTDILPFSLYWYHRIWQKRAFLLARELHNRIGFDLVHQITNTGFREPGYLWRLPTPFTWGPMGGMENLPWRFIPSLGVHGIIFHSFRNVINVCQVRWAVRSKRAAGRAGKSLIAATTENRDKIARFWGRRAHVICEIGRGENRAEPHSLREEGVPLRLAWSGEHISRKALPILLDALSLLEDRVEWRLDIFGNGNRTGAWRRKAQRLGIDERCTWHDWIPREKAMAIVGGAHIFVITSLSDMTSSVLMEAISLGVPVICLDHCGFRDVVTEKCGIKIPVRTPAQVSAGIAGAIEKIWNDEPGRRRMAEGALRRAEDFSWEGKMEILNGIYADALESGRGKS